MPSSFSSSPLSTLASSTQWSPHSMRLCTLHSRYESASSSTMPVPEGDSLCANAANRSSPGLKDFSSALETGLAASVPSTFSTNRPPGSTSPSTARSFATATVRAGGSKLACDTQETSEALRASPSIAVSAHREPTTRPTAFSVSEAPDSAPSARFSAIFRFTASLRTSCAKSVPLSSQICIIPSVGVNLHLIASKAKLKPPSCRRLSSSSTASPLQPNEPNTPHGF
mmetsp:Transcript_13256/g.45867  ORF Transcript_13256/g.45867 Transcript_13256/m.45867 type:complete len:227 (-) Transcript_13256:1405-2085(-)